MNDAILKVALILISLGLPGCSTFNAYQKVDRQSVTRFAPNAALEHVGPVQIERGTPRPLIDGAGRLLGLPNRLAIGDARVDNHNVSLATEMEITNYLEANGLNSVLVRSNQYDPVGEMKRMISNDEIRPFWKATFGGYNWLKYTLLPGRLTGGDWYNPYSKTLNVYSDTPVLLVSQATYAQDVSSRVNPGAYAAIKDIPLAGLSHETTATKLAEQWYAAKSPEQLAEARKTLYPSYGASVGSQIASFFPYGEVIGRFVGGGLGQLANKVQTLR